MMHLNIIIIEINCNISADNTFSKCLASYDDFLNISFLSLLKYMEMSLDTVALWLLQQALLQAATQ